METHLFSWTGDFRWLLITGIFETGGELTVISGSNFELEIEVLGRGILLVGVGILSNPLLVLVMSLCPGAHPYCSIIRLFFSENSNDSIVNIKVISR